MSYGRGCFLESMVEILPDFEKNLGEALFYSVREGIIRLFPLRHLKQEQIALCDFIVVKGYTKNLTILFF